MLKGRIICIDIETTGLDRIEDEILQVAIINGRGKTIYNSYIRPDKKRTWQQAEAINKINWKAVRDAPTIRHEKRKIERILKRAGLIVGYNLKAFDLPFLAAKGINTAVKAGVYDVMLEFAPVAGKRDPENGGYKWKSLKFCADWYGYVNYKPHDALEDVRATLHCYNAMQRGERRAICGITKEICRYTGQRGGNWCMGCEIAEEADDE